jgi:hypothetical protein
LEDILKPFLFASLLFSACALSAAPNNSQSETGPCPCFVKEGCTKWYIGTGVSFSDLFYFNYTGEDNTSSGVFFDNDSQTQGTTSAPSLGYNVFLGYSFNDFIDLELKGVQIVRPFKTHFQTVVDTASPLNNDNLLIGTTKLYVVTFGPYVLLNLPLYKAFTPYFRVGMVTDLITFKVDDAGGTASGSFERQFSSNQSFWMEKLNVGVGFKSSWKDLVSIKFEYETPVANTIMGDLTTRTGSNFYVPGILSASILLQF